MRWDNIEGSPLLMEGPAPEYDLDSGLHRFSLAPGQSVTVRIPRNSLLRVRSDASAAPGSSLVFTLSRGLGLRVRTRPVPSEDGRDLLVTPPEGPSHLCAIANPLSAAEPAIFSLFVSRREGIVDIAPYRDDLPVPENSVAVSRKGDADYVPFARGDGESPLVYHVDGPARLRVESRGLYTDNQRSRRRQYAVRALLDGAPFGCFQHAAIPNETQLVTLDGEYKPVAGSRTGYLDIPEGQHRLDLTLSIPALVRVSRLQTPDYLIPPLNSPKPSPVAIARELPISQRLSVWAVDREDIDAVRNAPGRNAWRTERVARRLVRDNSISGGGLLARDLLGRAADVYPAYRDIRGAMADVAGAGTGFRDLLPSTPQPLRQKTRWVASFRYKENTYRGMALPKQLVADTFRGVGDAVFTRLNADSPLEFRIPERSAPSRLRFLALHPAKTVQLVMQDDSGEKTVMDLLPEPELESDALRPSIGTAALAVAALRYPGLDSTTLGGPFGAKRGPAPLVAPAVIELPLSPEVKRFTLAIAGAGSAEVAVQYLGTNQFSLGESAYVRNLITVGGPEAAWRVFRDRFTSVVTEEVDKSPRPADQVARLDLVNDWIPVIRHLRALDARFRAGIVDETAFADRNGHRPRLHATFADAERSAREHMQAGVPTMAVEDWAEAVRIAPVQDRGRVQVELAKALAAAGEQTLAVNQLKGVFLFSRNADVVDMAYARLKEIYLAADNTAALLPLQCVRFTMAPSRHRLADLAVSLAENEYAMEGVKLGLLVSDVLDANASRMLRDAALSERWSRAGQVFYPNGNKFLAQGMAALAANDPLRALPLFREAGEKGKPYVRAIRDGLDIQQRLFADDPAQRRQAVLDWERWQWNHPGGRKRVSLAPAIVEHGGTMSLKSKTRGLRAITYVSAPGRPVKARFYGPLVVKVVTRPVHATSIAQEIEGWLEVREGDRLHVTPINGNWPSAGLVFDGTTHSLPGRAVEFEKVFGPGLHEIDISGQDLTLGVQLYGYRPSLPIAVLPPMTPDNVEAALTGVSDPAALSVEEGAWWQAGEAPVVYAEEDREDRWIPTAEAVRRMLSAGEPAAMDESLWATLDALREKQAESSVRPGRYVTRVSSFRDKPTAVEAIRGLKRTGIPMSVVRLFDDSGKEWFVVQSRPFDSRRQAKECLEELSENGVQGQVGEMSPELLRERVVAGYRPMEGCPATGKEDGIAAALGRGDFDEALALTSDVTPEDVLTRMAVLVRMAERLPGRLIEIESMAQELADRYPYMVGLKPLLGRITGLTAWRPVSTVRTSAGVRHVPTASWQNESPYLRARQAVFGPAHEDEILLMGSNPVAYSMQNPSRVTVVLSLELPSAPYRKPTSANIAWQVDEDEIHRIELTPDHPESTFRIDVPSGRHSLRVWIDTPRRNQFVRVRLQEPDGLGLVDASGTVYERRYYVATSAVPVVAAIKGPAWVRVDELRGRRTVFSYRRIGDGWHEIRLSPTEGDEALYRINSRTVSTVGRFAAMPPEYPDYAEMPKPPFEQPAPPDPTGVRFDDGFGLGGQEDGTWEIEAAAIRRRDVGEDTGAKNAEQFFQLGVRHRYYAEDIPAYFKTEVLARRHEHGGPTLELLEDFTYLPRSVPLTFNMTGRLYVQAPESGDEYWGTGRTEWSAYLRGRVSQKRDIDEETYHVPSASLFVRALSMGNGDEYNGRELDRDVYTDYKADHKIGLRLGETLYHRPFLDTIFYGGVNVTTNEQLNPLSPDSMGLRTGWSQLFQSVQTDLGYRFTHYRPDHDRASTSNRDFVDAGIHWDHWLEDQKRIRLGFKSEYDLDLGELSGGLTFSWLLGDGRGLRDVRPRAEERFHDLKERTVPQERNNAVDYVLGQ